VFVLAWGSFGSLNGQFNSPKGIGLDTAGNVFVADTFNSRVEQFAGNGTFLTAFGIAGSGNGQLLHPQGVAVDARDNVYVMDTNLLVPGTSDNRVEVFAPFHDVAATRLTMSRNTGYVGVQMVNLVALNLTVSNYGLSNETFWMMILANNTIIAKQNVTLASGLSQSELFAWQPNLQTRATYNITGRVQPILGDPNLANNIQAGQFYVRMQGDVNGDCKVDIVDLSTIGAKFGLQSNDRRYLSAADLNNDGVTNIVDLVLTAGKFGQTC
jgi:hypothetical protein